MDKNHSMEWNVRFQIPPGRGLISIWLRMFKLRWHWYTVATSWSSGLVCSNKELSQILQQFIVIFVIIQLSLYQRWKNIPFIPKYLQFLDLWVTRSVTFLTWPVNFMLTKNTRWCCLILTDWMQSLKNQQEVDKIWSKMTRFHYKNANCQLMLQSSKFNNTSWI